MTSTREQDDKAMITGPDRGAGWPHWPFLPMKQRLEKHSCPNPGLIFDKTPLLKKIDRNAECYRTVYFANFWAVASGEVKLSTAEKKVYESVDAMIADGWMVD